MQFDVEAILEDVRNGADHEHGRRTVEEEFADKLRAARVRFSEDLKALYRFMLDPNAPPHGKAVAIGALLYFITPLDMIPDVIPVLGMVDDAAAIGAAVAYLGAQLAKYRGH